MQKHFETWYILSSLFFVLFSLNYRAVFYVPGLEYHLTKPVFPLLAGVWSSASWKTDSFFAFFFFFFFSWALPLQPGMAVRHEPGLDKEGGFVGGTLLFSFCWRYWGGYSSRMEHVNIGSWRSLCVWTIRSLFGNISFFMLVSISCTWWKQLVWSAVKLKGTDALLKVAFITNSFFLTLQHFIFHFRMTCNLHSSQAHLSWVCGCDKKECCSTAVRVLRRGFQLFALPSFL